MEAQAVAGPGVGGERHRHAGAAVMHHHRHIAGHAALVAEDVVAGIAHQPDPGAGFAEPRARRGTRAGSAVLHHVRGEVGRKQLAADERAEEAREVGRGADHVARALV